ncbi:hypothetical protein [Caldicellulosiruptor acetigenus]|uniref:hypothetical protein n=1 Tax=Caldicellulosiruptor acetigenus TaxID=301953 RepID=UPI0003089AEC|nr:hypothetical protein [Caldicellulosiruptor acetigenus]
MFKVLVLEKAEKIEIDTIEKSNIHVNTPVKKNIIFICGFFEFRAIINVKMKIEIKQGLIPLINPSTRLSSISNVPLSIKNMFYRKYKKSNR